MSDLHEVKGGATAFEIFRAADAKPLEITEYNGLTPIVSAGLARLNEAGAENGAEARVVFEAAGFSLTYAWFKSGFPLPLHSHRGDCLYYVTGGSLKLGTEILSKGDGFFVPGETPYTYMAGSEGVEVLEIRHENCGDIKLMAKGAAYWDKAVAKVAGSRERWSNERLPETARG